MAEIRERNMEIGELSESTQVGVTSLQKSMRQAVQNLGQFKIGGGSAYQQAGINELEELEKVRSATQVYREEEMTALESAEPTRASI